MTKNNNKKLIIIAIVIVSIILITIQAIFLVKNNQKNDNEIIDFINTNENEIIKDDNVNIDNSTNKTNEETKNNNDNANNNKNSTDINADLNSSNESNQNSNNTNSSNTVNDYIPEKENVVEEETTIPATIEYYCLGDYTLNGTKCSYTLSSEALINFYCDTGTLSGSTCKIPYKTPLVNKALNWCSNNGMSGAGACPRSGCSAVGGIYDENEYRNNSNSLYWCYSLTETTVSAKTNYYCPDGFDLSGNQCTKYYETDAPFKYTCPNGYNLIGNNCVK